MKETKYYGVVTINIFMRIQGGKNMKTKKILAFGLIAAMTLGSTMVVMADGATGTTGTSTQFDHLEKKVTNVVYPTIAEGTNPFNFIVDPERLITAAGGKYKNVSVTLPTPDDGVYFATASDNAYASTSQELTVTNKSSHAVNVSATAKASVAANSTMMDLVAADAVTGTDAVKLYLGITVGSDTKALTADADGVTATASVAGVANNFEVVSKTDGTFEYKVKDGADSATGENAWKTTTIKLTGKVNTVTNLGSVVAPSVAVTWTAVDPDAAPADTRPVITGLTKVSDQDWDYTATFTKGTAFSFNTTGLTEATWCATVDGTYATSANITVNNGTVTVAATNWAGASAGDKRYVKFKVGDDYYIVQFTIATA